jgi:hypothetical protein
MAASPGYRAKVKVTAAPVAHTAEALANADSGAWRVYQITNTARRILWLAGGLTVKVGGVTQSPALYTVDALFGKITFLTPLGSSDVVTADTHYLPTVEIAAAKGLTLKVNANPVDTTAFGDRGEKSRIATLLDAKLDLEQVEGTSHEFTTGISFDTKVMGRGVMVVEFLPDSTRHEIFRAFVLIDSAETKAVVAAIAEGAISFVSTGNRTTLGSRSFGWGVDN